MKTNYILLILLLSFSFASAQTEVVSTETQTNNTVSVFEVNDEITANVDSAKAGVNENDAVLIEAEKVKESVARSSSDIRIYLNRMRNVDNINLLFPNLNKAKSV
jgi:hypothetical protein